MYWSLFMSPEPNSSASRMMRDRIIEPVKALTRRHFMEGTAAGTMAALLGSEPRQLLAQNAGEIKPKADTLILLWMAGGMAQTETFDRRNTRLSNPEWSRARVLSTFPSIDTVVDNIKLSQGLEAYCAACMDRGTLIRTHRVGDLAAFFTRVTSITGIRDTSRRERVAAPHIGSVIARTLGPKNPDVPAFIDVGQSLDIGGESDGVRFVSHGGISWNASTVLSSFPTLATPPPLCGHPAA